MDKKGMGFAPLPSIRLNPGKPWYLRLAHSWQLWVIITPSLIYLAIFRYFPMYGAILAFKDYDPYTGILNSPWVGLFHFTTFFNSFEFQRVLENTVLLSVLYLVFGFPFPIVLALMLNSAGSKSIKKSVQMTTFIPYFISTVVMVTIIIELLHPRSGIITLAMNGLGLNIKNPMGDPNAFKTIYIVSGIWQNVGYNAIIFIAALASVDPNLYEAAIIDGATKMQRIKYIDFPVVIPTAVILFILSAGRIMNVAFEKIYLMQNNLNLRTSEVISTYVYKVGLIGANFSFGTAVGLFNSLINLILLIMMNQLMRKYSDTSLW